MEKRKLLFKKYVIPLSANGVMFLLIYSFSKNVSNTFFYLTLPNLIYGVSVTYLTKQRNPYNRAKSSRSYYGVVMKEIELTYENKNKIYKPVSTLKSLQLVYIVIGILFFIAYLII